MMRRGARRDGMMETREVRTTDLYQAPAAPLRPTGSKWRHIGSCVLLVVAALFAIRIVGDCMRLKDAGPAAAVRHYTSAVLAVPFAVCWGIAGLFGVLKGRAPRSLVVLPIPMAILLGFVMRRITPQIYVERAGEALSNETK
jgi:hypothetical protein